MQSWTLGRIAGRLLSALLGTAALWRASLHADHTSDRPALILSSRFEARDDGFFQSAAKKMRKARKVVRRVPTVGLCRRPTARPQRRAVYMVTEIHKSNPNGILARPRIARAAYWVFTVWIVAGALWPGVLDILHAPPLYPVLLHLGYPPYFSTLLGAWKVLGGIVLLAPGLPLLKEWAYAGMFFEFSSACVSHLAVGDGASASVPPVVFAGALAASWYLRPSSRRLPGTGLSTP
jgi:hypothetical protein